MPRIVVCADQRIADDVAAALGRRGWTVGRIAAGEPAETVSGNGVRDVAVVVCSMACPAPGCCPYGPDAAAGTDVVLIGRPAAGCTLARTGCRHCPEPDDAAVAEALIGGSGTGAPAAVRRGPPPASDGELAEYLHHELRTPLTAIQSALEILPLVAAAGSGPDPTRLLEIVRANLVRLDRSVAWSEEWHRLRNQAVPCCRRAWRLGDLVGLATDRSEPRLIWSPSDAVAGCTVIANRDGIVLLVRQIGQALERYAPDVDFRVRMALEPDPTPPHGGERDARLTLTWLPTGDPAAVLKAGRVVRTRSACRRPPPYTELDRLVHLVVDRRLLAELAAQVAIGGDWGADRPAVEVELPVTRVAAAPSEVGVG